MGAGAHFGRTRMSLRAKLMQRLAPTCFCAGLLLLCIQVASLTDLFKVDVSIKSGDRLERYMANYPAQVESSIDEAYGLPEQEMTSEDKLVASGKSSPDYLDESTRDGNSETDGDNAADEDYGDDLNKPSQEQAAQKPGSNTWPRSDSTLDNLILNRDKKKLEQQQHQTHDSSGADGSGLLSIAHIKHLENTISTGGAASRLDDSDSGADAELSEDDQAAMTDLAQESLDEESSSDWRSELNDASNNDISSNSGSGFSSSSSSGSASSIPRNATYYDGIHMVLAPQITLPRKPYVKAYNSGQNFWPLYRILKKRGWGHPTDPAFPDSRASMLMSRGRVPYLKKGKQMLNSIGVSGCIGGAKLTQLACRQLLASHHGCTYEDLKIQPAQYNMNDRSSCEALMEAAARPEHVDKLWLWKPSNTFHGQGIKVIRGYSELKAKVGACSGNLAAIIMEYVAKPATMQGGYKFDLRSYLLVASLDPQLVFYADGFARKSDTVYNPDDKRTTVHVTNSVLQKKDNHFFNFAEIASELTRELGFPTSYIERAREYMKRVSLYVFKTTDVQDKKLSRFPGRFHVFAIDWLIDQEGSIHLLEGNGYPLVTDYPVDDLTPQVWEDMMDLVLKVHVTPHELPTNLTVKDKFQHGKWSLIYNELEEKYHGNPFSPCYTFPEPSLLDEKARRTQRRT